MSFGTVWEGIAAALPDAVAVRAPGVTLTFAQFDARAARLAATMRRHGVRPGATVACYLYNGPEYLEAVFAAFKVGAVPVNVNYRYRGTELTELLADADAEVLMFADGLTDAVRDAAARVPTLRLLVQVGADALPDLPGGAALMSYRAVQATAEMLPHGRRPGTDRLFMYTGGTTGRPKGVIWELGELMAGLSYATYVAAGQPVPQTLDEAVGTAIAMHAAGRTRVSLPVVPLMHGTGLFNTFGTLLTAGEVVFTGTAGLDPARVWQAVARHRVTNLLIAGNAIARPLVDTLVAAERAGRRYDLSSLRTIISSGTTFTDDLKAALHRRAAVTIYDGLAASEGGPFAFAVSATTDDLPSRFRPTAGTLVIGADGAPLAPGADETGVLAFGGGLPLGYHKDPERTAATFRIIQGRRHVIVGDHVRYEADGTLRFLGRGGGVINTGGEKVYPAEVEEALLAHPAIADAIVLGEPDETWGERVAAVVAVHPGTDPPTTDELLDWMRPRLAGYKLPRRVAVVAELPRTPTGKLELSRARKLLHQTDVTHPPTGGAR
jgi:acyl-CoA synthetase (AMP-forming)/AMP-acid ligase II